MVRKSRVVVGSGLCHVDSRFARGMAVFDEGDEAERFVELLRRERAWGRDGLGLLASCQMSSHCHVALRTGPVRLSRSTRLE